MLLSPPVIAKYMENTFINIIKKPCLIEQITRFHHHQHHHHYVLLLNYVLLLIVAFNIFKTIPDHWSCFLNE